MTDPFAVVVAGYGRLADRYDRWADAVHPPLRERFVDWLDVRLPPGSSVLELGCGTGRPVAQRLSTRHDYLGIDATPEMVAAARRNVPAGRFLVADMRSLEYPAESFEAVIALYSIIHVPRAEQSGLFADIRRWLRPGGYFVASLSADDLPAGTEDDWLGAGPMFWSGYDSASYRRLLAEAGFDVFDASVLSQMEPEGEVRFLWVTARAA